MNQQETVATTPMRDWRFEWLRIIAMLLIVATHFFAADNKSVTLPHISLRFAAHESFMMSGQVGVTLFVLISAYFLSKHDISRLLPQQTQRLVKLWTQVFFYSVLGVAVYALLTHFLRRLLPQELCSYLSTRNIVSSLFPIIFNNYWFITAFFVLMLIAPYVNIVFHALSQRQAVVFLTIVVGITLLWKFANPQIQYFTDVAYLLSIYMIGAFIRKYEHQLPHINAVTACMVTLLCYALCVIGTCAVQRGFILTRVLNYPGNLFIAGPGASPVLSVIVGTIWFLYCAQRFSKTTVTYSQFGIIVATVSPATFGVYLIHENFLIKPLLWNMVFRTPLANHAMPYEIACNALLIVGTYVVLLAISFVLYKIAVTPLCKLSSAVVRKFSAKATA